MRKLIGIRLRSTHKRHQIKRITVAVSLALVDRFPSTAHRSSRSSCKAGALPTELRPRVHLRKVCATPLHTATANQERLYSSHRRRSRVDVSTPRCTVRRRLREDPPVQRLIDVVQGHDVALGTLRASRERGIFHAGDTLPFPVFTVSFGRHTNASRYRAATTMSNAR